MGILLESALYPGEPSVRIATWNLLAPEFARPGKDGRDYYARTRAFLPWADRRERIVRRIEELNADVLFLQEVSKVHWPRGLEQALVSAGYRCLFAPRPDARADGVVLAVRSPWTATQAKTLLMADGTDKVCLVAQVAGRGGAFTAACVHLKWSETDELPMHQLSKVLSLVDEHGRGPAVVAGDLNFDVVESSHWASLEKAGWRSCYADDPSPTWCADGRARKLDALLVRGLDFESVRPLPLVDPSVGLPSAVEPSDHLPLVAEVG